MLLLAFSQKLHINMLVNKELYFIHNNTKEHLHMHYAYYILIIHNVLELCILYLSVVSLYEPGTQPGTTPSPFQFFHHIPLYYYYRCNVNIR